MTKSKTSGKVVPTGRLMKRASKAGGFVLGREAFGKLSEIEGIVVSRGLQADLRRLGSAAPERRREELAEKYGKK